MLDVGRLRLGYLHDVLLRAYLTEGILDNGKIGQAISARSQLMLIDFRDRS